MGRKSGELSGKTRAVQEAAADLPSQPEQADAQLIADGDFMGHEVDLVVRALADGVHSLFSGEGERAEGVPDGGVDLAVAGSSLDLVLAEYLGMVEIMLGGHNAKIAALAFCDTCLPYASLDIPIETTYAQARKIKGKRK